MIDQNSGTDWSSYHDGGGSAGVTGSTAASTPSINAPASSPTTVPATTATTNSNGMTSTQQSAYDEMAALFASYGLPTGSDITDVLRQAAINGDSAELTQIALQNTATWKIRFAGNEQRRAAGLNVLSVGDYLQQENQYATIMRAAGVPQGFFDDPSDFADFIGRSISPAELQDRVNGAEDIIGREDPSIINELARRGLTQGHLLAYALDPDRAAPLIKRDLGSILIGAAASRAGITSSINYSNQLAERGVGEAQAQQGFGQVAAFTANTAKLGNIYGVDYEQSDALAEVFDYNQAAADKRKHLADTERSNFSGSTNYGINKSNTAGQF